MFVYFLRHANAGERLASPKKDEKRGLDKEGIEQCGYVGRALAALDAHVRCRHLQPLKRSTQTASLVGNEMGFEGKLQISRTRCGRRRLTPISANAGKYAKPSGLLCWWGTTPICGEFLGTRRSAPTDAKRHRPRKGRGCQSGIRGAVQARLAGAHPANFRTLRRGSRERAPKTSRK